jgi:hypothetical protein
LVSALRADVAERHVDHEQALDGHDMHEFMRDCDLLLRANPSSEAIDA